jgi:hypothetical protein
MVSTFESASFAQPWWADPELWGVSVAGRCWAYGLDGHARRFAHVVQIPRLGEHGGIRLAEGAIGTLCSGPTF